ncbi:hypothetical protein V8F33_005247 [Rhypophila sp. PSN 637]
MRRPADPDPIYFIECGGQEFDPTDIPDLDCICKGDDRPSILSGDSERVVYSLNTIRIRESPEFVYIPFRFDLRSHEHSLRRLFVFNSSVSSQKFQLALVLPVSEYLLSRYVDNFDVIPACDGYQYHPFHIYFTMDMVNGDAILLATSVYDSMQEVYSFVTDGLKQHLKTPDLQGAVTLESSIKKAFDAILTILHPAVINLERRIGQSIGDAAVTCARTDTNCPGLEGTTSLDFPAHKHLPGFRKLLDDLRDYSRKFEMLLIEMIRFFSTFEPVARFYGIWEFVETFIKQLMWAFDRITDHGLVDLLVQTISSVDAQVLEDSEEPPLLQDLEMED